MMVVVVEMYRVLVPCRMDLCSSYSTFTSSLCCEFAWPETVVPVLHTMLSELPQILLLTWQNWVSFLVLLIMNPGIPPLSSAGPPVTYVCSTLKTSCSLTLPKHIYVWSMWINSHHNIFRQSEVCRIELKSIPSDHCIDYCCILSPNSVHFS